jgi:hypothetical protein
MVALLDMTQSDHLYSLDITPIYILHYAGGLIIQTFDASLAREQRQTFCTSLVENEMRLHDNFIGDILCIC